ncbi:MAG: hypothetical protein CR975_01385 [Gammaproteobacteria bacterium]|nr:MAG: hypothetical protein CR975_01385 [Gammaproteobacteria bacterium]
MKIKTSSGFTILELVSILAIIGVLIGLAAPSFINATNRSMVMDATRGFEGALKAAKHAARTSGRDISICPVENIGVQVPTCNNWDAFSSDDQEDSLGWVVFRDANGNDQIDANETIKKVPFDKSKVRVMWNNDNIITITPRSGANGDGGTLCVFIPGKTTLSECKSDEAMPEELVGAKVVLSSLGSIRTEK